MGFWTRLWHRLLFGSSPLTAQPRPAARAVRPGPARPRSAAAAADDIAATIRQWVKPQPPRYQYRSREELELALLLPWLTDAERPRFLERLLPRAGQRAPWTSADVEGEPWEQCQEWEPLVIQEPATMSSEGFCCLLKAELTSGLITFCTPLWVLSRPVRMLWLWRHGRRAGQVYAALEQALGSRHKAMDYAWWVIAGL